MATGPGPVRGAGVSSAPSDGVRATIIVEDREHGVPYSKGLMANTIMATGLSPVRAYQVAQAIEDELLAAGRTTVTAEELSRTTAEAIRREAGARYATAYEKWQTARSLDVPVIVLIGGGTGVGKSTIATHVAARLGIVRIVSTDAIREVMKGVISEEMMPALHVSSFEVAGVVRARLPRSEDALIVGFRDQVSAVAVGVRALVERAIAEGTDMVIEGAHLVPGFTDLDVGDRAVVCSVVITLDDEDRHRSHFSMRATASQARPMERYLAHFPEIRRIQKYVKSRALERGTPVIANHGLDATLTSVIDLVVSTCVAAAKGRERAGKVPALRGGTA